MDEQPTGTCPTCARRDPRTPLLCDVCRSRLRSWLGDIPDLVDELQKRAEELAEPLEHRPYVATVVEKVKQDDGTKVKVVTHVLTRRAADQVAYVLPAGASSNLSRTGPVSGSREPRLPINEDQVDLTGPARSVASRASLDEDAVGFTSIASTLDFWVEDWRSDRGAGEGRPPATVPALARWLLDRADDAMDHSPPIDEFFQDVRRIHGALCAQLGLIEPRPELCAGIPCRNPDCDLKTLYRMPSSTWIECGSCGQLLTEEEYAAWCRELLATSRKSVIPAA